VHGQTADLEMQEGQHTRTIYALIKERHFSKAIEHLEPISEVVYCCTLPNHTEQCSMSRVTACD
jgi:hypothetical protein